MTRFVRKFGPILNSWRAVESYLAREYDLTARQVAALSWRRLRLLVFEGMETQEQSFSEDVDVASDDYDWQAALDKAQGREPSTSRNVMELAEFVELTKR